MRILHVIAGMDPGGAERMVLQLTQDALSRLDEVMVVSSPGLWSAKVEELGGVWREAPLGSRSGLATVAAVRKVRNAIGELRPHLVHSHNVRAALATRMALVSARSDSKHITTLHGLNPSDYLSAARMLKLAGTRVVACAPSVGGSLQEAGYPPSRLSVIVNGANLEPATEDRISAMRSRVSQSGRPLVVGVGRLTDQKNWDLLIEVAELLPSVRFVVAGSGELREHLVSRAKETGGDVEFIGNVDDIPALLGAADCLISTSDWEGLPLSLLEALSLGTPSVVPGVDGINDVIPESCAVIVKDRSPTSFAEAIERLIADESLSAGLREIAKLESKNWSLAQMLEKYAAEYQVVLGRPSQ